jgi:hypothetical protein
MEKDKKAHKRWVQIKLPCFPYLPVAQKIRGLEEGDGREDEEGCKKVGTRLQVRSC